MSKRKITVELHDEFIMNCFRKCFSEKLKIICLEHTRKGIFLTFPRSLKPSKVL